MVKLIQKENPNVIHIPTYDKIALYLMEHVQPDDLILTIGAGPVNQVAKLILNQKVSN